MANLFIFLAFLCDVVSFAGYHRQFVEIDCIYLAYFVILLRVKAQKPSLIFAFILMGFSAFINGNSVGIDLLFFVSGTLLHFGIVVYPKYKSLGTMYKREALAKMQALFVFAFIYGFSFVIKILMTLLLEYDLQIWNVLFSFVVNTVIFAFFVLCI